MNIKTISIPQWLRLPKICALCQHYHHSSYSICETCNKLLIPIEQACDRCSLPLPSAEFLLCGSCIKAKPSFDKVFTAYSFEEPLRTLLHNFKYKAALDLRSLLVNLMLEALPADYKPDCLVPVPLHPLKLKHRGFNQSAILAKLSAKILKVPCDLNLCRKIRATKTQTSLDQNTRRKNLKKAFVSEQNTYQHVTLVDDLLTTGSTAEALAYVLKKQGVKRVDVWCLARTPLQPNLLI